MTGDGRRAECRGPRGRCVVRARRTKLCCFRELWALVAGARGCGRSPCGTLSGLTVASARAGLCGAPLQVENVQAAFGEFASSWLVCPAPGRSLSTAVLELSVITADQQGRATVLCGAQLTQPCPRVAARCPMRIAPVYMAHCSRDQTGHSSAASRTAPTSWQESTAHSAGFPYRQRGRRCRQGRSVLHDCFPSSRFTTRIRL